jgi:hypothetical protein
VDSVFVEELANGILVALRFTAVDGAGAGSLYPAVNLVDIEAPSPAQPEGGNVSLSDQPVNSRLMAMQI